MSNDAAASEVLNKPVDDNAQAAEDAKRMLAELQADATTESKPKADDGKTATASEAKPDVANQKTTESPDTKKSEQSERPQDRRRDGHRGDGHRGRGGGRGRGGFKHSRDNIKSDLIRQEVSDDPVAIRKQVEFYFSDSNLPMDKFLLGKVGGSKNNPVEIKIIHSFKRMRHFQPFEAIVEALKESKILELTDDDTCVKRKEPLPENLNEGPDPDAVKVFEDKAMPRSVYAKGFGEEIPSTQFDIEAFFAPYGPTNAIRLRRTDDKIFKRSVFVEFESEELAKKFLELDPKPQYKGKDLLIMSKKEYCEKKVDDINSGKIQANSHHRGSGRKFDGRNGRDSKRKRDDEDNRDWRDRRDADRKNGFRDDKRRGGRGDRDRDSRGKGGRGDRDHKAETDDRGVPVVKTADEADDKTKRDNQKAEALARARAVVNKEAGKGEQKAVDGAERTEQDGTTDVKPEVANTIADSIKSDVEAVSKKRSREDDGEAERETKKMDVKA